MSVDLSSHFFLRGWPHFLEVYCTDNLCWELGFCCPCHRIKILGRFSFVLIGGDKGEHLRFTLISSSFEVSMGASSYSGGIMCTPFWTSCRKGWRSISRYHFREITWPFFFRILLNLLSNVHCAHLRSYVRPRMGAWLFACPIIKFFFFLFGFKHFLLRDAHQVGPPPSVGP